MTRLKNPPKHTKRSDAGETTVSPVLAKFNPELSLSKITPVILGILLSIAFGYHYSFSGHHDVPSKPLASSSLKLWAYIGNYSAAGDVLHSYNDKRSLLEDLNRPISPANETLLHVALKGRQSSVEKQNSKRGDHEQIIRELVNLGINTTLGPLCPLFYAVSFRNSFATEYLVNHVSKSDLLYCLQQRDSSSGTALHLAAKSTASGFSRFLIRSLHEKIVDHYLYDLFKIRQPASLSFIDINEAISAFDVQCLLSGISKFEVDIQRELLNAKDMFNRTALHLAAQDGRTESVKLLLQAGADPRSTAGWGNSPLHLACSRGFSDLCSLLAQVSDIDMKDHYGRTSVMLAASRGDLESVRYLVEHRANLELKDNAGLSAFEHAKRSNNLELLKYLEKITGIKSEAATPQTILPSFTHANGGWTKYSQHLRDSAPACQIDRRDATITREEFIRDFVTLNKPVAISGLTKDWPANQKWTKSNIVANFGGVTFDVGSIPYSEIYGLNSTKIGMQQFLRYMEQQADSDPAPLYIFEGLIAHKLHTFTEDFVTPPIFAGFNTVLMQFILGPSRSGAPPHFHGDAWNALIYGSKRWFLFPPQSAFFTREHPMAWFEANYDKLKGSKHMVECLQESGDIIFIPRNWGHAVLNVQESVAIAVEVDAEVLL